MILCKLKLEILSKLDFCCGMQFEKMAETHIAPQFFSGNIVNITHRSPLIKMVPLVESSGGARGPILAHGLLCVNYKSRKNKNKL